MPDMYLIELADTEFQKFRDLIYREAGIKLSDTKKALVQARLSKRVRVLGLASYRQYHDHLVENWESEKINFINAITTNKTEFFRENRHFEYLKDVYLPELTAMGPDEIRIWSAGCSTGEEPYTIAMTVQEYFRGKDAVPVKILATDIDTNVLDYARDGVYNESQVDKIDPNLLRRYFDRGRGDNSGFYRVKESLKQMIYFRRQNLQDPEFPMKKQFHIIFCRNVIIYFDKDTQRELFEKFYRYLSPRGRLFIGHSENILNITNIYALVGNTIYRKNL